MSAKHLNDAKIISKVVLKKSVLEGINDGLSIDEILAVCSAGKAEFMIIPKMRYQQSTNSVILETADLLNWKGNFIGWKQSLRLPILALTCACLVKQQIYSDQTITTNPFQQRAHCEKSLVSIQRIS